MPKTVLACLVWLGALALPGQALAHDTHQNGLNSSCAMPCTAGTVRVHTPHGHPSLEKPAPIAPIVTNNAQFVQVPAIDTAMPAADESVSTAIPITLADHQALAVKMGGTMMLGGLVTVMPKLP